MLEIIKEVRNWLDKGEQSIVIAVLIDMDGSAVRGTGAVMAVNSTGLMAGSVSGGCIESAVLDISERVFKSGESEVVRFCQIDDEILGSVSPCGGEVTVAVIKPDSSIFESFFSIAEAGRGGRWGVVSSGPERADTGSMFVMDSTGQLMPGSFAGMDHLSPEVKLEICRTITEKEQTGISSAGEYSIFSTRLNPVPRLIIVGASHIGIALAQIAEITGYRVTVVDPRAVFARQDRFRGNVQLLNIWPRKAFKMIDITPYSAVAVITHDTKIDDQALILALGMDCFYLGALGSSSTHKERVQRLVSEGIAESDCSRIHSPVGLKIDSANPEEIAVAIMAEIIGEYRLKYGK